MPHGIQHVIHRHLRHVGRARALLKHARAHKDRVPRVAGLAGLVEVVRAADVGFRGVADEIDRVGRGVDAVGVFAPLPEQAGGEVEGAELGLAEGDGLELLARDGFEHGFEAGAQGAHADAAEAVVRGPDDVVVGEEDGGPFVEGGGAGA